MKPEKLEDQDREQDKNANQENFTGGEAPVKDDEENNA